MARKPTAQVALTPKGVRAAQALDDAVKIARQLLRMHYHLTIHRMKEYGYPENLAEDCTFMALCELRADLIEERQNP